jgi:hypothetical protein
MECLSIFQPEQQRWKGYQMGKPMYNFGKNAKEKARQLKQTEKTAKRLAARKQKADMANVSGKESEIAEPEQDITEGVG